LLLRCSLRPFLAALRASPQVTDGPLAVVALPLCSWRHADASEVEPASFHLR